MTDLFRLYGIFGFPLCHTLSPRMQEAAFKALGLKAFYLALELKSGEFHRVMRARRNLLLDGFNVTVPYKEKIIRYLDGIDPTARSIGAVNTVVRRGSRWLGYNTDGFGFLEALRRDGKFKPRGKQILLLGAGGSARAVSHALAGAGAKRIVIVNRTRERAQKIISEFRRLFPRVEWKIGKRGDNSGGGRFDLVVNATSIGLRPTDPALVEAKNFPRKTLFFDLVYNPSETHFLHSARKTGHRTLNGLGMLVYQGAESFRLWTGRQAPVKMMRKALETVIARSEATKQSQRLLRPANEILRGSQ